MHILQIRRHIAQIEIDESAVCCGNIDRRRLAEIVFADVAKLEILNSIVHGAPTDAHSAN